MNKTFKLLTIGGLSFFLAACQSAEGETSNSSQSDWPDELIVVQMAAEDNPEIATKKESLREHLESELNIKVTEYQGANYAVGIEALASENVDVLAVSPQSYYQAKEKAGAEFLVTPQSDEKMSYYTGFYTQADRDDINSIEDLRGTNFAFVNPASSSGYLYPKGTLVQELDLDPDQVEQSGYFFENVIFSESHPNSLMGVAMGDFDAAAIGYTDQFDLMLESLDIDPEDIKEIGRTADIPDPSYVIRGDLPEDFKEKVTEAFESFDDEDYFETILGNKEIRFVDTPDDFYDDSLAMLEAINALEEE